MTTTTVPVRGSLRLPASILIVASILAIAWNVWACIIALIAFSPSHPAFTFHLRADDSTALPPGTAPNAFGYFTEAMLSTSAITFWPGFWISIAGLLWAVVRIVLAVCVLRFARGAYAGQVFSPRLPSLLTASAVALGVGGSIALILDNWGLSTGGAEIAAAMPNSPLWFGGGSVDLTWTILGALLLGLLAAVFRSGLRLQRDTEGLV